MPLTWAWAVIAILACFWGAGADGDVPSTAPAPGGLGPVLAPLTRPRDADLHDVQQQNRTADRLLSRRRRYVVFPKRSSIQLVIEFTVGLYVPLTTIFTTTLTWGLAWRLPSEPEPLYLQRRAAGLDPDHHHRAQLLADLAVLFDKLGLRGQDCVRRTLCDVRRGRGARGPFMEEVLKAVLTVPDAAAALDDDPLPCAARHPGCPSALDLPIDHPDPDSGL